MGRIKLPNGSFLHIIDLNFSLSKMRVLENINKCIAKTKLPILCYVCFKFSVNYIWRSCLVFYILVLIIELLF